MYYMTRGYPMEAECELNVCVVIMPAEKFSSVFQNTSHSDRTKSKLEYFGAT